MSIVMYAGYAYYILSVLNVLDAGIAVHYGDKGSNPFISTSKVVHSPSRDQGA